LPRITMAIRRPLRFCWYWMFLSVDSRRSNPASSAAFNNAPLANLSHPLAIASTTVWPRSQRAMLRGVPWSKRMSIGGRCMHRGREGRSQALRREMQHRVDLFARDGEFLHDFFHGQASFQILEHRGNRHPRVLKHPRAADLAGDTFHGGTLGPIERCHVRHPPSIVAFCHGSAWTPEACLYCPPPHLFQLKQAELFGAQGSFRPAFDYTLTIHHGEVVAYGFALVAEAQRGELEEGFRVGHGRVARGDLDHGGIHFRRRAEGGGRDFAHQPGGSE